MIGLTVECAMAYRDKTAYLTVIYLKKWREYEKKASLENCVITLLRPQKIVEQFNTSVKITKANLND